MNVANCKTEGVRFVRCAWSAGHALYPAVGKLIFEFFEPSAPPSSTPGENPTDFELLLKASASCICLGCVPLL
jgi:hypothetical protein